MTLAIRIFERLRLFAPLGLMFIPGAAHLPPSVTVPAPACLICRKRSHSPPGQAVWLQTGEAPQLILICSDCGFDRDDAEIEEMIIAKVSEPVE